MIRYFFVGIPSFLFEPIAVVTLLGCITTFLYCRKRNNPFFGITLTVICFMLIWRLSTYSLMKSTRYAAIILYPAIIFAVLFCFQVRNVIQCIIKKFPRLENSFFKKISPMIPYLLITGLSVVCIAKTLHYNPYGSHIIKVCKSLTENTRGNDFFLYVQDEPFRIAYYTGIDIKKITVLAEESHSSLYQTLKKELEISKNNLSNIYFIFSLKKGDPEPDAEYLVIRPEMGKWECIHREFTSRKKNKELVLYRFIPAHPNIEIWEKKIPDTSPDNLCKNGNFEQILSQKELKNRIAYYKKLGASDFYLTRGRFFPTQWWLGVSKQENGKSPEMALTETSPIAGKYSLEMKSGIRNRAWGTNSNFIQKQDCIFSGFIRAESKSSVTVSSCYWNADKKKTDFINRYFFHLSPGKTYRFSFPVSKNDVPTKDKNIYIIVTGYGHILLDNVEFIKIKK